MSALAGKQAMLARLNSVWGSTTPISTDGINGKVYQRTPGTAFIRPHFDDFRAEWQAIGPATGNVSRFFSTLVVEVFVPVGVGIVAGEGYCETLIAGFKSLSIAEAVCLERPYSIHVGDDNEWSKWMVFMPFYHEEVG